MSWICRLDLVSGLVMLVGFDQTTIDKIITYGLVMAIGISIEIMVRSKIRFGFGIEHIFKGIHNQIFNNIFQFIACKEFSK